MSRPRQRASVCHKCGEPFSYVSARTRKYDDACLAIVKQDIREAAARSEKHRAATRLVGLSNRGKSRNRGNSHGNWKGDKVGIDALHSWVTRRLGRPEQCVHCGSTDKKTEWANKSQQYKRELADWLRLCRSCHLKYDYSMGVRNGR